MDSSSPARGMGAAELDMAQHRPRAGPGRRSMLAARRLRRRIQVVDGLASNAGSARRHGGDRQSGDDSVGPSFGHHARHGARSSMDTKGASGACAGPLVLAATALFEIPVEVSDIAKKAEHFSALSQRVIWWERAVLRAPAAATCLVRLASYESILEDNASAEEHYDQAQAIVGTGTDPVFDKWLVGWKQWWHRAIREDRAPFENDHFIAQWPSACQSRTTSLKPRRSHGGHFCASRASPRITTPASGTSEYVGTGFVTSKATVWLWNDTSGF